MKPVKIPVDHIGLWYAIQWMVQDFPWEVHWSRYWGRKQDICIYGTSSFVNMFENAQYTILNHLKFEVAFKDASHTPTHPYNRWSIHLATHPFTSQPIDQSKHRSIRPLSYPSVLLSVNPSINLFTQPPIQSPINEPVNPSIHPTINPSINPFTQTSIHPTTNRWINPSTQSQSVLFTQFHCYARMQKLSLLQQPARQTGPCHWSSQ